MKWLVRLHVEYRENIDNRRSSIYVLKKTDLRSKHYLNECQGK